MASCLMCSDWLKRENGDGWDTCKKCNEKAISQWDKLPKEEKRRFLIKHSIKKNYKALKKLND